MITIHLLNPSKSLVYFHIPLEKNAQIEILIYTPAGRLVSRISNRVDPSQPIIAWDPGLQSSGVYLYLIYQAGQKITSGKICIRQ
ncbi:T9SS type A sorting domain-containing protein [bacterium]|nr:T9SS type A sorting domain-containing protein [bacterium]